MRGTAVLAGLLKSISIFASKKLTNITYAWANMIALYLLSIKSGQIARATSCVVIAEFAGEMGYVGPLYVFALVWLLL